MFKVFGFRCVWTGTGVRGKGRGRKTEFRSQKSGCKGNRIVNSKYRTMNNQRAGPGLMSKDKRKRTEVGGQRSESKGKRTEDRGKRRGPW